MKPCYLDGRGGLQVRLDGPALSARRPGRATTLVPLRRISRIIASGPVELATPLLLACAERGITVTFLHEDGALRAYLFGDAPRRQSLFQRLQDFLDRPDWLRRYNDWRRSIDSRARRRLCWRLQLAPDRYPLMYLLRVLRHEQEKRIGAPQRARAFRRLQGMARALAAELLAERGLDARRIRDFDGRIDLIRDLARWQLIDLQWPLLHELRRRESGIEPSQAELIALFEARTPRLRRISRTILNRLHRFLVEI